jgi:hypothetical protein
MTKADVEKLTLGQVLYAVNLRIPEGSYRVDRFRVVKINPKTVILERWLVTYPDRTSRIRVDKAMMKTFGLTVAEALDAYVADLRSQVDDAETSLELAREDLAEALEFKKSNPEAS